jgi:RND family efflux transporter MFP subunit
MLTCLPALLACDRAGTPKSIPDEQPSASLIEPRVRVRTTLVAPGHLDELGDATGVVEPFALARVAAETAGRVKVRHVDRGSAVEAGALLVELDTSRARIQLEQANATLAARESDRAQAERERARSEQLRARESLAAATYDRTAHQADAAAAAEDIAKIGKRAAVDALRDAKIVAPFTGTIADYHVEPGEFVGPGSPVVTLVDLSRVRLRVGVTAAEAQDLRVGDRLAVRFAELGGGPLQAELHSISPLADARAGTYAAELWLANPDVRLRDGMIGHVDLHAGPDRPESLLIPRAAVQRRAGEFSVWVVADGVARAREVALGRADAGEIEVLDGLVAGEQIVVDGGFALREGVAVEVEPSAVAQRVAQNQEQVR